MSEFDVVEHESQTPFDPKPPLEPGMVMLALEERVAILETVVRGLDSRFRVL